MKSWVEKVLGVGPSNDMELLNLLNECYIQKQSNGPASQEHMGLLPHHRKQNVSLVLFNTESATSQILLYRWYNCLQVLEEVGPPTSPLPFMVGESNCQRIQRNLFK
jgi:hypothetical protein